MSTATTLSGYTPPYIDYKPAKVGDAALHRKAVQIASERPPATHVTLSPAAKAAMQAHR